MVEKEEEENITIKSHSSQFILHSHFSLTSHLKLIYSAAWFDDSCLLFTWFSSWFFWKFLNYTNFLCCNLVWISISLLALNGYKEIIRWTKREKRFFALHSFQVIKVCIVKMVKLQIRKENRYSISLGNVHSDYHDQFN